ncbi:glycosyltransferase family 2 protein [Alisedimentitalea sp. MJ-SS2]|uniref:glycosyltransferase family 2 protein n=1 Tax=Aliisedimentitalea sp. MJ-SS2 TaxID=3049795 RepID=UPI00291024B8|nr:glycosyltransferase family 2 protein [Alisedimentitalea sp. MJ-SS2]MDU8930022.1 glycosyltransferase family 2 protein [Alisedimentitalea sp. MJ-SS2]
MKISVITVVLNPEPDFAMTAESILAQDHDDVEWVVLDGASWSGVGRAYLERYRDSFDQYASAPDNGVYAAMNESWKMATGDYIVFLNSGDIFFRQDSLSQVAKALRKRPDILYGDHDFVSGGAHHFRKAASMDVIVGKLRRGDIAGTWHSRFPCHQATFYRRTLFETMQYDEQLLIVADHDLMLRAHADGCQIAYLNQTVCRYYGGGYSAKMLERCVSEWTDTYSRFSDHPQKIMQHFMGNRRSAPPLAEQNTHIIDGHYPYESPHPNMGNQHFAWVRLEGLQVLSITESAAEEDQQFRVKGVSRFNQDMTIFRNGEELLCQQVQAGPFTLAADIGATGLGDTFRVVSEHSTRLGEQDSRVAGWAVIDASIIARPKPDAAPETGGPDQPAGVRVLNSNVSETYSEVLLAVTPETGSNAVTGVPVRVQLFNQHIVLEFRPEDAPKVAVPAHIPVEGDQWGTFARLDVSTGPEPAIAMLEQAKDTPSGDVDLGDIFLMVLKDWTGVLDKVAATTPDFADRLS